LHELYNLKTDPNETVNLAGSQKGMVEKYQDLIRLTFPEKTFKGNDPLSPSEGFDASKDKDLMESLKSLGYID
jgi:hypothetical protein